MSMWRRCHVDGDAGHGDGSRRGRGSRAGPVALDVALGARSVNASRPESGERAPGR